MACFGVAKASGANRPYFSLYADDETVASALSSFFSAGSIYRNRSRLLFRISKVAELMAVVGQCDAHPLVGGKAMRYAAWRELVLGKNGLVPVDAERTVEIVKLLNDKKI